MTARAVVAANDVVLPLSEKEVVDQVIAKFDAAEAATQDLRKMWDENWRLYHGKYVWPDKESWQCQQVLPYVYPTVEHATSQLVGALIQPGFWFSVDLQNQSLEEVMRGYLYFHLGRVKYIDEFENACRNALLSCLFVQKVWSGGNKAPLRIKTVSPFDFWIDPSGQDRWVIERVRMNRGDLRANPIYRNVSKVNAKMSTNSRDTQWTERAQLVTLNDIITKGEVEVLEYWGALEDRDGDTVARNIVCAIANRKVLVRGPDPNPFKHGRRPYGYSSMVSVPGAPYGKSLIETSSGLVILMSELFNLMTDAHMFAAMPMMEVDGTPGHLDPMEIEEGIYPGKVWTKLTMTPGPSVAPVKAGMVDPSTPMLLQFLDRMHQRDTSVTDSLLGMTIPRRGTTATEVHESLGRSTSLFDRFAGHLETDVLAPVLELALLILWENAGSVKDPWLERELSKSKTLLPTGETVTDWQVLQKMTPTQLLSLFDQQMRVNVQGISSQIRKADNLQRLETLLMADRLNPEFAMYLKPGPTLSKFIDALNLDSRDMLRTEEEVQQLKQQQMQAMMAQAQQSMGGQGGQMGQLPPPATPGGQPYQGFRMPPPGGGM